MDVMGFARAHLCDYKLKDDEVVAKFCPFCHGGDHKEQYSFSLSISKKAYVCHRASKCGAKGSFFQLCKLFNEKSDEQLEREQNRPESKKNYKIPQGIPLTLNSITIGYFASRGISPETLQKRGVKQSSAGLIMFIYTENGETVLIKYRSIPKEGLKSNHSCDAGGKPVFWGLDSCVFDKPLIIVEGEIDALTLDECGIENVVSVPFGAGNTDEVITNQYEKLLLFPSIILWGDNDKAGQEMVKRVAKRLGYDRCKYVRSQCKDANELLKTNGKSAVLEALTNPLEIEIENVLELSSIPPFDMSKIRTIKTGFKNIDSLTGGFALSCCSLVSGKTGCGKSTWVNNVVLSAVEQGYKVCVYSGELQSSLLQSWLELTLAGTKHVLASHTSPYMPVCYYATKEIQEKMRRWYRGKIYIYDNFLSAKPESILCKFEESYQRYNCQFFVIDNLMCLDFGSSDMDTILGAQSRFASSCVDFCHRYNVHVVLVQHPIKTLAKMQINDIRGHGDLVNKVSTCYLLHRNNQKTEIEIVKNRIFGALDSAYLQFNERCKRFFDTDLNLERQYGFEFDDDKELML